MLSAAVTADKAAVAAADSEDKSVVDVGRKPPFSAGKSALGSDKPVVVVAAESVLPAVVVAVESVLAADMPAVVVAVESVSAAALAADKSRNLDSGRKPPFPADKLVLVPDKSVEVVGISVVVAAMSAVVVGMSALAAAAVGKSAVELGMSALAGRRFEALTAAEELESSPRAEEPTRERVVRHAPTGPAPEHAVIGGGC